MKDKELKIGVILSYLSIFITNIISIIYTPIMLRLLGQSEYGLYTLVTAVISYLGLFSFGFDSAFIRYYSRYKVKDEKEKIYNLNGMFLIIYTILALLTIISGIFLINNTELVFGNKLSISQIGEAKILMAFMVFNIALSFPASVFNSNITANEKYIFQKMVGICNSILSPMIMLPLLLLGFKSISLVIASTVISITSLIINIYYCVKKLNMKVYFNGMDFNLMGEIAIFSVYIFMNMIVDQINWSVDKYLLGIMRGTTAVAIYGIGSQFNSYYITFSTAISNVFIPKINRMSVENDNNKLTDLFINVGRVQFFVLILILTGYIIFGKYFICVWAGEKYLESYYIGLILMIPITIPLIQNVGIEIQRAKNMHKFRSIIYCMIVVINVIVSIPLCKKWGGIGCVIGTAIGIVIGNIIIMNIYYQKKVGIDILRFWKNILKCVPIIILALIFGLTLVNIIKINSLINFIAGVIIYIIGYFSILWKFALNNNEKIFVKKIYMNLKRKVYHDRCKI